MTASARGRRGPAKPERAQAEWRPTQDEALPGTACRGTPDQRRWPTRPLHWIAGQARNDKEAGLDCGSSPQSQGGRPGWRVKPAMTGRRDWIAGQGRNDIYVRGIVGRAM